MNDNIEPTSKQIKLDEDPDEDTNDNIEPNSKRIKLDEEIIECSVCMGNILDNDALITKCNHTFHTYCINKWLQLKNNCPYCRTELTYLQPNTPNIPFPNISDIPFVLYPGSNEPSTNTSNLANLTNIPFALYPESYEPSGTINRSRLYQSSIQTSQIVGYSHNVRNIMGGMAGLSYSL